MEQGMQTKDVTMSMVQPPAYKETQGKSKLYVVGAVVTIVTLVVVSFVVCYLVFTGKSPMVFNYVKTDGDGPVPITREVVFETFDGVPTKEKMKAEGNKLTMENTDDGYTAVFDFDNNIAMMRNKTSNTCYYTPLDAMPGDIQIDNLEDDHPFVFLETESESNKLLEHTNAMVYSNKIEPIPAGYLRLTESPEADQCAGGSAFWVEPMNSQTKRNVRAKRDAEICYLVVVTDDKIYIIAYEC